jgi:putative hemolysin
MSISRPDFSQCKMGDIYLKLAETKEELEQAQKLRHFVFFEEPLGSTTPSGKLDQDEFDSFCEHLLVVDGVDSKNPKVVGTYRLLRRTPDKKVEKFYAETEFDISKLKALDVNLMELGRSCISPAYRDGKVIQLLWSGIGAYIAFHKISYLFGCASFFGTDIKEHESSISYLLHNYKAPDLICPTPKPEVAAKFNVIPEDKIDKANVKLPALIKGYLRAGCVVGEGAVIDSFCKTIDVFMIMDTTKMVKRYSEHFVEKKSS